jgi:hypothetical protein
MSLDEYRRLPAGPDWAGGPGPAGSRRYSTTVLLLALTAAAVRLIPLHFLNPLNWDELEFYRATVWVAEGRVPYRDFWQNHTPLPWFLFAPFAALTKGPGVASVIALRWAQVPVWIVTFWLANVFMRRVGIERFARWAAMALALSSSLFMIPAIEYRVDSVACMFYLAGLVLAVTSTSRGSAVASGAMFCLAGFSNLRLGPLLALTVLILRIVDTRERAWRPNRRINWTFAGVAVTLGACLTYFAATGSLDDLYHQVWYENYLGDKYSEPIVGAFFHRLLVPFGIRIIASDRLFDPQVIDPGGVAILVLGFWGMAGALRSWRSPHGLTLAAILQVCSLVFIAAMKFIYNYHFEIVVLMMLPLVAATIEQLRRPRWIVALVAVACCVNLFASVFRGKEWDRAFQDFVMREADSRTLPGEKVWSGAPWALRREPAYRFWLLPEIARHLVRHGHAQPYALGDVLRDPPAAVVFDHNALVWTAMIQREIAPFFVRHYIPVWRNLWVPALNTRLAPQSRFEWVVPRDGTYRMFVSPDLATHPWFRDPLLAGVYEKPDSDRLTLRLPPAAPHPALAWWVDGKAVQPSAAIALRKHQRVAVANQGPEPLGLILLPGDDTVLFRQPPSGATLEAATTRVTHVPHFGAKIQR